MQILIISHNPQRPSFRQRIEIYRSMLAEQGIESQVEQLPDGAEARRNLFKKGRGYDAIFLHKKRLNGWDAFWMKRYARRVIYDFDDAVMFNEHRPEKTGGRREKLFRRTVRLAETVIAGNDYLAEQARRDNPQVVVLPTGLDTTVYQPGQGKVDDGQVRLVWIGSKSTLPYLRSISEALEKVGQRYDNVRLRIIADDFFELENMTVEKVAWSLAGQYEGLSSCDIGLAPLTDDNFTRGKCGFKILQYFAAGLATVASPVGVNAQLVQEGKTGGQAVNTEQWVEKLQYLIEHPDQAQRMGQKGRKLVTEKYDQKVIGKQLVETIRQTITGE